MELDNFIYEKKLKKEITNKNDRDILLRIIEIESKKEISNEKVEQKEKRIQGLFEYINKGYKDYKDYKNLVKKENIVFENYFKNKGSLINNFESFNDNLQKVIIKSKANKLKRRIISKKYNYLCDKETESLFLEMAQMDFTKQELQDFIGKKLSAFHYSEELNGALMNLMEIKEGWSVENWFKRIEKSNLIEGRDYEIKEQKEDSLILNIKTFKASQALGSKMWCITRESYMYDHYREDMVDYQFHYDFSKPASDDSSMTAVLYDYIGEPTSVYSKADKEISKATVENPYVLDIIEKTKKLECSDNPWDSILHKLIENREFLSLSDISDELKSDTDYQFDLFNNNTLMKIAKNNAKFFSLPLKTELLDKYNVKRPVGYNSNNEIINLFETKELVELLKTSESSRNILKDIKNEDLLKVSEITKDSLIGLMTLASFVSEDNKTELFEPVTKKIENLKEINSGLQFEEKLYSTYSKEKRTVINIVKNKDYISFLKESGREALFKNMLPENLQTNLSTSLLDFIFDWENTNEFEDILETLEKVKDVFLEDGFSINKVSIFKYGDFTKANASEIPRLLNLFKKEDFAKFSDYYNNVCSHFDRHHFFNENPIKHIEKLLTVTEYYENEIGKDFKYQIIEEFFSNSSNERDLITDYLDSFCYNDYSFKKNDFEKTKEIEKLITTQIPKLQEKMDLKIETDKLFEILLRKKSHDSEKTVEILTGLVYKLGKENPEVFNCFKDSKVISDNKDKLESYERDIEINKKTVLSKDKELKESFKLRKI